MNSVHTATTSGPLTAVSGLRVTLNAIATSVTAPTAIRTGVNENERPDQAAQAHGKEEADEEER